MGPPGTVKQSRECDTRVARIDTSDERTVEDSVGSFGVQGFMCCACVRVAIQDNKNYITRKIIQNTLSQSFDNSLQSLSRPLKIIKGQNI